MNMKKLHIIFWGALIVYGQSNLTMDQFLAGVRNSDPVFTGEQITQQRIEREKAALRGIDDWQIESQFGVSYIEPSNPYISGFESVAAAELSGGLSRYFWNSGGSFSGGLSFSGGPVAYASTGPGIDLPDQNYEHSINLGYVQPLLKNFRGRLTKLPIRLKDFEREIDLLERADKREAILASAASAYVDWAYFEARKEILAERLTLAEREYERTKEKFEAHLVDQVDVIRAETSMERARLSLESLNSELTSHLIYMTIISGIEDLSSRKPELDIDELPELKDIGSVQREFKTGSRLIALLRKNIELLEISREGKEEELKTNLNLAGNLSLAKSDGEIGESFILDQPTVSVGLSMDFPLDNKVLLNEIEVNKLSIEEINHQITVLERAQLNAITKIHSTLKSLKPVIELQKKQIEIARRSEEAELAVYQQGRSDFTFVIQAEDAVLASRLAVLETKRTFHKLFYQLEDLTDSFMR